MIAADTNVLVRFLVRDDEAQAARARQLVETCLAEGESCLVSHPVLCELEWVLDSVYRASRADVSSAVRGLLSTPPFVMEDPELVARALLMYSKGKGDLSDYLLGLVGRSRGARTTYTFDRDLRDAEGFTLLRSADGPTRRAGRQRQATSSRRRQRARRTMKLPEVVAAADWSVAAARRRMAVARLGGDGRYVVASAPEGVGEPAGLLARLREAAGVDGVALVGFDFPIGVPRAYARIAGVDSFRQGLKMFGTSGPWRRFYDVTDQPSLHQPFGPKSNVKGGLNRQALARRLGLGHADLFRRCELKTPTRPQAESVFFTRFAKQVGRAAADGWRTVLAPSIDAARLWPFDGNLAQLLASPGIVVAEVYPAEAVAHLGLPSGPGRSKRNRTHRAAVAERLATATGEAGIDLAPAVRDALGTGFNTDDEFDAFSALVSMVLVVRERRPADPPDDEDVRAIEGWILGQDESAPAPVED